MNRTIYHIQVTIRSETGEIFFSNELSDENLNPELLEVELGMGQIFPKVEVLLPTAPLGELITIDLPPEDAFGDYTEDKVRTISLQEVPQDAREVGSEVVLESTETGDEFPAVIRSISDDKAELDMNHPLAGQPVQVSLMVISTGDSPLHA